MSFLKNSCLSCTVDTSERHLVPFSHSNVLLNRIGRVGSMSENLKKSQGGCLSCLSSPMFAFATCCKVEGAELLVFGVEKMGGGESLV